MNQMKYVVYRGVYPFNEVLGTVEAPEDQPELALSLAIKQYSEPKTPSPVVEAMKNQQ